jgi:hypothetical protein
VIAVNENFLTFGVEVLSKEGKYSLIKFSGNKPPTEIYEC